MKLTITTHLWFPKIREIIRGWFDFSVDLTSVNLDEDEIALDLSAGRD